MNEVTMAKQLSFSDAQDNDENTAPAISIAGVAAELWKPRELVRVQGDWEYYTGPGMPITYRVKRQKVCGDEAGPSKLPAGAVENQINAPGTPTSHMHTQQSHGQELALQVVGPSGSPAPRSPALKSPFRATPLRIRSTPQPSSSQLSTPGTPLSPVDPLQDDFDAEELRALLRDMVRMAVREKAAGDENLPDMLKEWEQIADETCDRVVAEMDCPEGRAALCRTVQRMKAHAAEQAVREAERKLEREVEEVQGSWEQQRETLEAEQKRLQELVKEAKRQSRREFREELRRAVEDGQNQIRQLEEQLMVMEEQLLQMRNIADRAEETNAEIARHKIMSAPDWLPELSLPLMTPRAAALQAIKGLMAAPPTPSHTNLDLW